MYVIIFCNKMKAILSLLYFVVTSEALNMNFFSALEAIEHN